MSDKIDNIIILENAAMYLSDDELKKLDEHLFQYNIHLKHFEDYGVKASFNDIRIFISENITELIITGLLMLTIYDTIKSSMKIVVYKIKEKVKILQSGKIRRAIPCLEFKTKNGQISAPIPSNLSEKQFERYMDEIKLAIESIRPNSLIKYESFVVEQNEKSLKVEAKTMHQYAQEQCRKQKNEKKEKLFC